MTKHSGMTLLELVVAIAIFSVVAAAGYGALAQGLAVQDKLREQRSFWQNLETAFNLIASDLEQALDRPSRNGLQQGLAFSAPGAGGQAEPGRLLAFTRRVPAASFRAGAASPFLRVAYSLQDGGLYRETWPHPDQPYGTEADGALLLSGVEAVHCRFLDPAARWTAQWPQVFSPAPAQRVGPPKIVELTVALQERGVFRWLFHVGPPA